MSIITFKVGTLSLHCPKMMPLASTFLWNSQMMIQLNCRGYATAQFMQPEPAKYARGPALEATSFMQPEQSYYAHHPGRFFYVKDEQTGELFSAPYEPVRAKLDRFEFIAAPDHVLWKVEKAGIAIHIRMQLDENKPIEIWQIQVSNLDNKPRKISVYPYFPIGYMSWMNQSACYSSDLNAVICQSITPYQKYPDHFKQKNFKDCTFLLAQEPPDSWECRQQSFEGEGGLHAPDAINAEQLPKNQSDYETPTAALQYRMDLAPGEQRDFNFLFGPAKNTQEISEIRTQFFSSKDAFNNRCIAYTTYIDKGLQGSGSLKIETPDKQFDQYVNYWLPRQIFYHGDINRLSTDPQTRNFLQDNMGLSYINPEKSRRAFLLALSQQKSDGAMPDGILLSDESELKYINQVPHTDHCVWLPICLRTYLDETNDFDILSEIVPFADSEIKTSADVFEHINRAMQFLANQRDERGLSYINQGDWCDPMNMVGYRGQGVSGWLTLATGYALNEWSEICRRANRSQDAEIYERLADNCNESANKHLWQTDRYARGITDDGNLFGIESDPEGKLFLNPQSWAILSGAADTERQKSILKLVEDNLSTPYGLMLLAPAFTSMREDIGRVTQKFPGSAENGSVYNHASAFYIYALFQIGECDKAFELIRQILPNGEEDLLKRGQIPTFIPNYYRGAYQQFPRTAGRSSQLFNTGTVHWFYRCLIDGLFGLRGDGKDLIICPQLPSHWDTVNLTRYFRGAKICLEITRSLNLSTDQLYIDGILQTEHRIKNIQPLMYKVKLVVGSKE